LTTKTKSKPKETIVRFYNGQKISVNGLEFIVQNVARRAMTLRPVHPEVKDLRRVAFRVREGKEE
jgi:hypothetical protein